MEVMKSFSLEGKVALVTGGAGLYGRQIVEAIAEAGAVTYTASRNLQAQELLAQTLADKGLEVIPLRMDQGDEASVLEARDAVLARSGKIDILVNNAVARPLKNGWQSDVTAFAESMRINATGVFTVTRAMGDCMSDGGSIINIGSMQGMIGPDPTIYEGCGFDGWSPDYFFHKGGMINLTRFVASYYGERGIRCNCISPGGFQAEYMPERFIRQYSARTFLGRLANGTDLKGIVVFLASDASAYVTGTNIPVDGGYTAK
jgi:NAD(P)-dependent dehydrogenase (short-subunit alcohol dehydrogenase family)